jgi:UDP-N-acetylmuramate--alanine ligase
MSIAIGHDGCNIPADTQLLVYSDAIPVDNVERVRARDMGIREVSYFEALGEVSRDMRTVAVAGTHGKTTTTGMLAKVLLDADVQPTVIVGSIVADFGSNFVAGRDDLLIVEACEYRDHLLNLLPEILVVTNVELDHTDYFPTLTALQQTFRTAMERVPAHGYVVTNPNDANIAPLLSGVRAHVVDYTQMAVPTLKLIGQFNIMNAQAAKSTALLVASTMEEAGTDTSLSTFRGSWRRFEYKGETPKGAIVYDDYAHHPTAIRKTIEGVRDRFPGQRIVVAFHPHLYSRTKSLLSEFADALSRADTTIVAPIYAAREMHDPSVSNHILAELANEIGGQTVALDTFDEIRDELLKEQSGTIIITMGAGDIYKVAEQLVAE